MKKKFHIGEKTRFSHLSIYLAASSILFFPHFVNRYELHTAGFYRLTNAKKLASPPPPSLFFLKIKKGLAVSGGECYFVARRFRTKTVHAVRVVSRAACFVSVMLSLVRIRIVFSVLTFVLVPLSLSHCAGISCP